MPQHIQMLTQQPPQDHLLMKNPVVAAIITAALVGCATQATNPQIQSAIAACRTLPREPGNYARRARCELDVESRAYLTKNPEMADTWRELINDTLAEYALADQGGQSIRQADVNAALLRKAAETGTGCLTDQCGADSKWNFPSAPPY